MGTTRLLQDPTTTAALRRDLGLASGCDDTTYDVVAGLARFIRAGVDQKRELQRRKAPAFAPVEEDRR